MRRWLFVGAVGIVCGALLGWLLWSLTASAPAAALVGAGVSTILLALAWGGARHNSVFRQSPERAAQAAAKRRRVQTAIEESRRQG